MPRRTKRILKYCDVALATASPRRRALIQKITCVRPVFLIADVQEVTLCGATLTALANARKKCEYAVLRTDLPVLAFDTVVGIGDTVFGKPKTKEQAVSMFETLCGNTHEVVTAVCLGVNGKIIEKFEKTFVTFGAFDSESVYNYIDSGAPFDKAGGYNIDDAQIKPLILRVDGDYDNVVGLPVALTEKLIEENLIYGENGNRA